MDYNNTPSFYNNEEFFNKYLGNTSYYLGLQNVVMKLIRLIAPGNVLEFGSALGTTTIKMAKEFPEISFEGVDLRPDIVEKANDAAKDIGNVYFLTGDMNDTSSFPIGKYDLIYLLYSFHHIEDPVEKKVEFLHSCYECMKPGAYLLIVETFLPENAKELKNDDEILRLWRQRSLEGYASTYWEALETLSAEGIELAKCAASISQKEEYEAGYHVFRREDEYHIKFSWLEETARSCGFEIVISEPVNCIEEKAILLRKK